MTNKILEATTGIVALLDPLTEEERTRVIHAAMTVLGGTIPQAPAAAPGAPPAQGNGPNTGGGGQPKVTAKEFFDTKEPKSKIEELATAARFRECHEDDESSTKAQLKQVIKDARRNFDDNKFNRDITNARTNGIFNKGTGKDSAVLSHYGQNFIDALPDREKAKALRKPVKKATKKKASKKSKKKS